MPICRFEDHPWPEIAELPGPRTVAILPLGAVEAHGPHLPLSTDVLLANGMAESAARELSNRGWTVLILPPITYSAAPFAAGFAGTISVRPETVTALVVDVVSSLWKQGFSRVVLANAHFDPSHLGSIYAAIEQLETHAAEVGAGTVLFPDVTRRRHARRLTPEFQSGACHAGCYEGSMVMALRPELVRDAVRRELPEVPVSLSEAIRSGATSFEELGGDLAYVGAPAEATAEEGRTTLGILGKLLVETLLADTADY